MDKKLTDEQITAVVQALFTRATSPASNEPTAAAAAVLLTWLKWLDEK